MTERPCSACGYDLSGLPPRGRCPECGQAFNMLTGEGVADARARGKAARSLDFAARLRTLTFAFFAVATLAAGGVGALFAANPYRPLALAAVVGAVFVMAAVTSYLYEND